MRLTRTTAWVGGTALLALLAVAATWLLLVGPRREEASALREQTTADVATNDALAAQVQQLELQLADVPATRAEVAALREQVPVDAALPDLLRQVSALAKQAGADLTGVTPTEPVVDPAEAAATPTPAPSATSEPADDAAVPDAAATTAPADPATVSGVEVVPVTITAEGTFSQVQELLRLVQVEMARAVLVRGLTMSSAEDSAVQLTLTAEVFSLPATDADAQLAELGATSPALDGSTSADPSASPDPGDVVPTDGATPLDAVAAASGTPLPTSPATQPTTQTTAEAQ